MRSIENFVNSMQVMEVAFGNIMNEIIEHVIEGICFEAHRSAKFDYFPIQEYILKDHEFEIYNPERDSVKGNVDLDIYGNTKSSESRSKCPLCGQEKDVKALGRHVKSCERQNGSQNNGKRENSVNIVEDEANSNGKKGNDEKKTVKSILNYDTMSPDQIHLFLSKHCGVISKHTKKPCNNKANCIVHSQEDKDEIRTFFFERSPEFSVDEGIDIDTVD